jgi:hypothetical protein
MLWLKLSPTILLLTLCPSVTSRKPWSTRSSTLKPGRLTFARKSTQKFHGNIWWRHAEPVLSLMPPQQFSSSQCKPNFSRPNSGSQPNGSNPFPSSDRHNLGVARGGGSRPTC